MLCGIPLRPPPSTEFVHRRRNGKFLLEIVALARFGLPFCQDRLIPIWTATLAVKQTSVPCLRLVENDMNLFVVGYHKARLFEAWR